MNKIIDFLLYSDKYIISLFKNYIIKQTGHIEGIAIGWYTVQLLILVSIGKITCLKLEKNNSRR